jgi:glycosyltransferase involved in cell wall biosynthesis
MKPVIIHVVQHLKPGGIESFALEFQRAAKECFDVHIISLEKHSFTSYWGDKLDCNGSIHMLNKKPGWEVGIVVQLKNLFKELKPCYVHTHHIGPLIYGGLAARLANVKNIIHTEHDAWHLANYKPRLLQKVFISLIRPIYVADAQFVAQQVNKLIPSLNPVVITNGIDVNKFKPSKQNKKLLLQKFGLPTHLKFIGCAARLESVKAHDVLINALYKLPQNIGLLLAGTGSLQEKLEELVKELHLEKRVFFLGHVEDMTKFYPLIEVFCLSSHNEGLPLSPMEAQACGVPAVLTDVGGCREAVCTQTGLVVEPNNPKLLSKALLSSINSKSNLSPRKFIEQKRSINEMIEHYISCCSS